MNERLRTVLVVLLTLWLASLTLALSGISGMRYATGLPPLVPMSGLDRGDAYYPRVPDYDRAQFQRELAPVIAGKDQAEAKVLAVLDWVMNQFPIVENWRAAGSWEMVEHGRTGGGTLCGGMAQVFRDALLSLGIPAREITFQRNPFNLGDTHVSVEAWIDGKWRLFDPTFHIALRSGGQRVGVAEAQDWFIVGSGKPVDLEFLGEVKYPPRLEKYYIRFQAFFDNYYVNLQHDNTFLDRIPILRRLNRRLAYPDDHPTLRPEAQDIYRLLYVLTMVVLPALSLLFFLAAVSVWLKLRRSGAAKAPHG